MDEKLKKALECCSRVYCCACPKVLDGDCMETLAAEVENYISDLEERLAITQESMEALERRCNVLEALEQRCKALEKRNEPMPVVYTKNIFTFLPVAHCPKCGKFPARFYTGEEEETKFCPWCGQAVQWNE